MRRENRGVALLLTVGAVLFGMLLVTSGNAQSHKTKKPPQKSTPTHSAGPDAALIAQGVKVYAANNCATCHAIAGKGGNAGPDLTHEGESATHTPKWLSDQVANPKSHNPDTTMPAFAQSIKGAQLTAIAAYLASLKEQAPAANTAHSTGAAANPAVLAKIEKLGGTVGPIAQNDDHLDVSLHMGGANVTDASLSALTGLKNVVHLDLGQTAITDAGLASIKGMTGLTELHLEGTKITDAGLVNLKGMTGLTYLNLYGTNITDAGLDNLTHLSGLKHLYVWQTKVTQAGADKLKKALPQVEIVMGWDQTPPAPQTPPKK